jgi:hypothetical protein
VKRTFVSIFSTCVKASDHGLHVWIAFARNRKYTTLSALCTRCGAKSTGSVMNYDLVRDQIDQWWAVRETKADRPQ